MSQSNEMFQNFLNNDKDSRADEFVISFHEAKSSTDTLFMIAYSEKKKSSLLQRKRLKLKLMYKKLILESL
ncbi:9867_t:CDS:2 [Dentiscutata erythropus]|uniref:9867_t:CDS:1 n=1 Tax=Dentiscutata erythropus TaxID=1348616 RepID=A0A9N9F4D3_9GLOM|nr:9867_t:CDS:2 [Dentiscutata erythropus]